MLMKRIRRNSETILTVQIRFMIHFLGQFETHFAHKSNSYIYFNRLLSSNEISQNSHKIWLFLEWIFNSVQLFKILSLSTVHALYGQQLAR